MIESGTIENEVIERQSKREMHDAVASVITWQCYAANFL